MIIKEITCKSALTGKQGDYTLNPYVGCRHGCAYCYAVYIARWKNELSEWGTWVHVKTNIPEVLEKQLRKVKAANPIRGCSADPLRLVEDKTKGIATTVSGQSASNGVNIFMSTICDVYQPVESKYKITRKCLEVLSSAAQKNSGINVLLLTKSDLIVRDIDVLKSFPRGAFRAGFSVNTVRDDIAALFERNAPAPSRRFIAIQKLKENGINVGIFVSPILPFITEKDMPELINFVNENHLDFIGFDTLNYISRDAGRKARMLYKNLGKEAQDRFRYAATNSGYISEIRGTIRELTKDCKAKVDFQF